MKKPSVSSDARPHLLDEFAEETWITGIFDCVSGSEGSSVPVHHARSLRFERHIMPDIDITVTCQDELDGSEVAMNTSLCCGSSCGRRAKDHDEMVFDSVVPSATERHFFDT